MKKLALLIILVQAGALSGARHLRTTSAEMESEFPSLAANGTDVGVAWMDGRDGNQEIYFRTADVDRGAVGPEVRLTNSADWDDHPQLCWDGAGYGLSYIHESGPGFRLYFQRLGPDGRPRGAAATLESGRQMAKETRIFCTGVGYGIVYTVLSGGRGDLHYQYLDGGGSPRGGPRKIADGPGRRIAGAVARSGADLAVFYLDADSGSAGIIFIDPFGAPRRAPLRLNPAGTRAGLPDGTSSEGLLLAVWAQKGDAGDEVMAATVSPAGEMIGAPFPLALAGGGRPAVAVAASPSGFGAAWFEVRDKTRTIMFRRLDAEGQPLGPAEPLYEPRELKVVGNALDMVWDGQGFVIARSEVEPPINTEIVLTRVPH